MAIGSGRHYRQRRLTTDEVLSIDIRLVPPRLPHIWIPGEQEYPLYIKGTEDVINLGVKTGETITEINQASVTYSPRNFGGEQAYFLCPYPNNIFVLSLTF